LLPANDETIARTTRFKLPYINGRLIVPVLLLFFVISFRARIADSFNNINTEPTQEILFLVFIVLALVLAFFTAIKKLSLIPVLGMMCCLYLMIEIPARSWVVFFGWMAFGLIIYFCYGYWKSKLVKAS
jgi:hypothetical protein